MKITASALLVALLASGCVHTTANPVQLSQVGDDTKSCRAIENEMVDMKAQVQESDSEGNGQVAKNVALGVTGAFLIVPLFFMDTSDAHAVEAKAASARYRRLQTIYEDRSCAASAPLKTTSAAEPLASASPVK